MTRSASARTAAGTTTTHLRRPSRQAPARARRGPQRRRTHTTARTGRSLTRARRPGVYRRRRLAVLALLVTVVAGVLLAVGGLGNPASAEAEFGDEVVTVVAPGDTLWGLAMPHAPAGVGAHAWVATVLTHNGLDHATLRPGDVLRIPVP